jgi:hypothetical protein
MERPGGPSWRHHEADAAPTASAAILDDILSLVKAQLVEFNLTPLKPSQNNYRLAANSNYSIFINIYLTHKMASRDCREWEFCQLV